MVDRRRDSPQLCGGRRSLPSRGLQDFGVLLCESLRGFCCPATVISSFTRGFLRLVELFRHASGRQSPTSGFYESPLEEFLLPGLRNVSRLTVEFVARIIL